MMGEITDRLEYRPGPRRFFPLFRPIGREWGCSSLSMGLLLVVVPALRFSDQDLADEEQDRGDSADEDSDDGHLLKEAHPDGEQQQQAQTDASGQAAAF